MFVMVVVSLLTWQVWVRVAPLPLGELVLADEPTIESGRYPLPIENPTLENGIVIKLERGRHIACVYATGPELPMPYWSCAFFQP